MGRHTQQISEELCLSNNFPVLRVDLRHQDQTSYDFRIGYNDPTSLGALDLPVLVRCHYTS